MIKRFSFAAALLAATAPSAFAQAALPAPEFLGQIVVPSGLSLDGIGFGGISDLAYDAANERYLAISDDRVENGPARFYSLRIDHAEGIVRLDISAPHELTIDGEPIGELGADGEGIAIHGERLFWSSERDAEGVPGIFAATPEGDTTATAALPDYYIPNADGTHGVYGNLSFEGLTVSSDGSRLIAALENGLAQDGPKATLDAGSPSRILLLDSESLAPAAEHLYVTEPIHTGANPAGGWNDNGISAIETLPDGRLVVVERSFAQGVGNYIRFFVADLSGADDILGQEQIDPATVTAVDKTLWFTIDEGDFGLDIDNVESFAFGPVVDGQQIFVIASDDNFNPSTQFTQFVAFSIPAL